MAARMRYLRMVFLPVVIFLISLACNVSSPKPNTANETTGIPPASKPGVNQTDSSQPGQTRKNPIPIGTQISIPGWDVEVRQFLRGADALKIINTGAWQAQPLPKGQEYALAKVFVRNTSMDENYHDLGISQIFITGDQNLAHGDTMDGWPQPEFLFEDMYTAEAVEGWVDGVIPIDEHNMELVLDVSNGGNRYTRFFALENGAGISFPKELANLKPNDLGKTTANPAVLGQQVITPDWAVTLIGSVRGQEAEAILQKDNSNYKPPAAGQENLLLHIKLQYISASDQPGWIGADRFYGVDSSGNPVRGDMIYTPSDRVWITATVLPGAEMEGWEAITILQGSGQTLVVFNPESKHPDAPDQNRRYIAVK
jgi:hypothetical protein